MNRSEVLEILSRSKPVLVARYGVARIALFESTARGTARPDIDILIAFDGPATSERYFGVQFFLEDLLGRPVDLVTGKALRPELRPFIERGRCMSDTGQREWCFYIDDMIGFAAKVIAYTQGLDQDGFVADSCTCDATVRNLELIGDPGS